MIRQLMVLCGLSLVANSAVSQEQAAIRPVLATVYYEQGHLECEVGPGLSDSRTESGTTAIKAHDNVVLWLTQHYALTCYNGGPYRYVKDGSWQMPGFSAARAATAEEENCQWTVILFYTFASGRREGFQCRAPTYCDAYRGAWAAVCAVTCYPEYGPVCAGTGRCKVKPPRCCCHHPQCPPRCTPARRCGSWFRRD